MGWLDHSTNNIILDAVLTDYGRQQLAAANSSFNIVSYSLADDEVDYKLIKKYGRAVGKEKIEKNTPIFEAQTNQNIAIKYKLIGMESRGTALSTAYLPVLKSTSSTALTKGKVSGTSIKVDLFYNGVTGNAVPIDVIQTTYTIRVSDRFFYLDSPSGGSLTNSSVASSGVDPGDSTRTAVYYFTSTSGNLTSFNFNINARSIDNTTMLVYGKRTSATERTITSYITISGDNHGCTIDIPITYTATVTTT